MRKTSHNHSPIQHTLRTRRNKKTRKQQTNQRREKAVCIIGGESEALGFIKKQQKNQENNRLVLYKTLHYFLCTKTASFWSIDVILMCLEILLHKHKAVIKVPGIAKQTVNRK